VTSRYSLNAAGFSISSSSSRLSTPVGLEGVRQARATYRSIPEPCGTSQCALGSGPASALQFGASVLELPVVPREVTVRWIVVEERRDRRELPRNDITTSSVSTVLLYHRKPHAYSRSREPCAERDQDGRKEG
jgi:hypothetical protein